MNKNLITKAIKKFTLKIYLNKNIDNKSFDEIGLDSLKKIQLISYMEKKFKFQYSDRELSNKTFKKVKNFINVSLKKSN